LRLAAVEEYRFEERDVARRGPKDGAPSAGRRRFLRWQSHLS